jgi:acetyltransferase
LQALAKRAEFLATETQPPSGMMSHRELEKSPRLRDSVAHPEDLVRAYGILTEPINLARDENEAVSIANELGYPVVIKIASPDISHKSDFGGVLLNIEDAQSLQSGYTQIVSRVKERKPEARIEGVYIQRQIPQGQEVIVGMLRDPQFGPLMMFGSGGVEVEGLKDVAFALAPLNQAKAEKLIRKTWAGRKLKGFRDIPPADEESVIDVLIKISRLAMENEPIEEIEINPLRVLKQGAVALDVRIKSVVQ